MPIYTRKGDAGTTGLGDGTRVSKSDARVEAYGTLDELGAALGFARIATEDLVLSDLIAFAQQRLFTLSASLATPGSVESIASEDIALLERAIDRFEQATGRLTSFVLSGGTDTATRLHLARTIARRAERRVVALMETSGADVQVLPFLNRLSDALFAAARYANATEGVEDQVWEPDSPRPTL